MSERYNCKTRHFKVTLMKMDPTGLPTESQNLLMKVIDDENCMRHERLFIEIGECLYHIDKKGHIIDQVVPHDVNKKFKYE